MPKPAPNAFTLIEILVVIAIMGITGVFVMANYRNFGADRNFKNASLDIQNFLRLAQSNATANVLCFATPAKGWMVVVGPSSTAGTYLELRCDPGIGSSFVKRQDLSGNNTAITKITRGSCTPNTIKFTPLSGAATSGTTVSYNFTEDTGCGVSTNTTITLSHTGTTDPPKHIIVEPGGRIYEQ